eukprot:9942444-Karenia_brevis.AAC.1
MGMPEEARREGKAIACPIKIGHGGRAKKKAHGGRAKKGPKPNSGSVQWGAEEGERLRPPDKDRTRGTREKRFLKAHSGTGQGGAERVEKDVARPISIAHGRILGVPERARREGESRCPPDTDWPWGTREERFLKANAGSVRGGRRGRGKDIARLIGSSTGDARKKIPESDLWECLLGRRERGKHVARPIRIACGGNAKQNS